jgi:hypothetical protein
MKTALVYVGSAFVLLGHPGPVQATCLDSATSIEIADESQSDYDFDVPDKGVDARGVHWVGIPGHALRPAGNWPGCWVGGYVEGPYPENSVYECTPIHCPDGVCPTPCWEYHTTAGMRVDIAAPVILEDVRISDYGDGIERSVSANREPLIVKGAYLHDIHDDAIENDWGASIVVLDSLLERVFIAFASRPRSGEEIDASDRTFEVRDSLILAHRFTHAYKNRAGHEGFWKWPHDGTGPNFIITGNTFVVVDEISGSLVLPLVDQVLECADNTLLWAGSSSSWNGWIGDPELASDGFTNADRVELLSDCFTFIVKPDAQSQADFLAEHFDPLATAWKQSHPAAGGFPECSDGLDNDGDGGIDYTEDLGCDGPGDTSELSAAFLCDNGVDDDLDTWTDVDDPGCLVPTSQLEDPQCQDGVNNDGDALIDFDGGQSIWGACSGGTCPPGVSDPDEDGIADPDPQCVGKPWKNRERSRRCGIGFEQALLLALLGWAYGRRRRRLA